MECIKEKIIFTHTYFEGGHEGSVSDKACPWSLEEELQKLILVGRNCQFVSQSKNSKKAL